MTRLTELDVPRAWEAAVIAAFVEAPEARRRPVRIGIAVALATALLATIAVALLIFHR